MVIGKSSNKPSLVSRGGWFCEKSSHAQLANPFFVFKEKLTKSVAFGKPKMKFNYENRSHLYKKVKGLNCLIERKQTI
ncbi:MAG: hypothetical protein BRC50_06185 [Cyanobacteria bacterium SW_11_48_12]|nr:MAG: hypothetical protein BRC50_06185 [Cyanobacteria bacterium SW_11_48_12]